MKVRAEPPSTKDCTDAQYEAVIRWQRRVYMLVQHAADAGVVINIDNPPNEPLAMGNYDLVVSARVRRAER